MRAASPPPPSAGLFVAGFFAAVAVWLGLLLGEIGMPTRGSFWMHQLFSAKEQAARHAGGPKLVVVGGSGTLYSVRARDLSRELGIPVVNGGLHAGLGRSYILHEAKRFAQPGDTVLLALEYELYVDDRDDPTLLDYLVSYDPGYFLRMDTGRQLRDILAFPLARIANPYLGKLLGGFTAWPFYLDADGDVLGNNSVLKVDYMRQNVAVQWPNIGVPTDAARADLRSFSEWARANRVRVLAVHPATIFRDSYVGDPGYGRTFDLLNRFHEEIGIPYIDQWMDSMMDQGLFFDTVYHTSEVGAELRTHELARELEPYVDGRCWGVPPVSVPRESPYETIDRNFQRFEPIRGFSAVHGMDAPAPRPFIESLAAQSEALIRTSRPSHGHLVARLRASRPGQRVEVRIGGSPIATWSLDPSTYRRFETDVELRAGANSLTLIQLPTAVGRVEIEQWRIDLPAEDAAASADQRERCSNQAITQSTADSGDTPTVPTRTSGFSGGS
ncbi:MAG TPA: hypothetical protein VFE23_22525 [Usitatibacter sp.]|nr:hypothetical protein [Usitatibacter sp.]